MRVSIIDKHGRHKWVRMTQRQVVLSAFKQVIEAHDSLYKSVFGCPPADPKWDIPAKLARDVFMHLKYCKPMSNMKPTIESKDFVR